PGISFLHDRHRSVHCFGAITLQGSRQQNVCPLFAWCYRCARMFRSLAPTGAGYQRVTGWVGCDSYVTAGRKIFMTEESSELEGPDFETGVEIEKVYDGGMLLGHAFGEAVLIARRGDQLFAIGATCTHYGGPLAKGLMIDCTVHCPWHHARFDLRT